MAGQITTNTFYQAATKVVKATFIKNANKVKPLYTEVFAASSNDSKRPFMTVLPIVELGTMSLKPEGSTPVFDQAYEGTATTFNFLTYALAYKITEEAELEDAKDLIKKLPAMLAYSEQVTKELLFWNVFNLAFTSGVNGADGVPLCSASHPLGGGTAAAYGTVSNSGGSTALTPESLQNAYIAFETLNSDRNLPSFRTPKKLVVPPQLHKVAQEILGSPYYPYSNENKVNVVNGTVDLLVSRYITSNTAWFLTSAPGGIDNLEGDTNSLVVSFKWQNKTRAWVDEATGNMNQRASFRCTYGWVDFRGFYGSQGS